MDIFGSRALPGYPAIVDKFLCGELKKATAAEEDVQQVMKYVDWVKDEYAGGDYSMIEAVLVASSFPPSVRALAREAGTRLYTHGRRPARTSRWSALKLIQFTYDSEHQLIRFATIPPTQAP
jgi:hypothetical protein